MENLNKEQKIYSFSYMCMMCIVVFSSFIGIGSYLLFQGVKQNAVIASLSGTILGILIFILFLILNKNMKDMNIIEYNKYIFGNFIGNIFNIILNVTVFFIASVFLQNIVNFINTNYLLETSTLYIKILLIAPICYAASQKITTISNISVAVFFIDLAIVIVSFFGMQSQIKFERIYPIMSCGFGEFAKYSILYAICGIFGIFLLNIVSKKERYDDTKIVKKFFIMYFVANLFCIVVIFFTVAVLGADLVYIYNYPEYFITQEFSLFSIIERVENTLCLSFIFNAFFTITLMIYFISKSITISLNLKMKKDDNVLYKDKNYYFVIPIIITSIMILFTDKFFKSPLKFNEFIDNYYIVLIVRFYYFNDIKFNIWNNKE